MNNDFNSILKSLQNVEPATNKPFLATRVKAAIANQQTNFKLLGIQKWITKPVFALIIIAVIVFTNAWAINQSNDDTDTDDTIANVDYSAEVNNIWMENTNNK